MYELDRRQLLGGMLSLAGAPLLGGAEDAGQITPGIHDIGIPYLGLATPRQNCPQWCWAASIETIFRAHGHPVRQETIVNHVFGGGDGSAPCFPATDSQMILAVDGDYTDRNGVAFEGRCVPAKRRGDSPSNLTWWRVAKSELRQGRPLLAGYRRDGYAGHAVVITHMRIFSAPGRHERLISMTVRDPWPGSRNLRSMEPEELRELYFVAAVLTRPRPVVTAPANGRRTPPAT